MQMQRNCSLNLMNMQEHGCRRGRGHQTSESKLLSP